MPRDAAHERCGDRDADRRGGEIMDRERDHLGEIRHGRFATVVLPIGVGRETDGRVERQMRHQRRQALRIERIETAVYPATAESRR